MKLKGFINKWINYYLNRNCPDFKKQRVVKSLARKKKIKVFIETGTYLGTMVNAVKNDFDQIFSIEIDKKLYRQAKEKLKQYRHIKIVLGDSSEKLETIIKNIKEPCLFWLDGHYSGGITGKGVKETPIIEELTTIFKHPVKKHIVLIDDARLFIGKDDYPTLGQIKNMVRQNTNYEMKVKKDIIKIYV